MKPKGVGAACPSRTYPVTSKNAVYGPHRTILRYKVLEMHEMATAMLEANIGKIGCLKFTYHFLSEVQTASTREDLELEGS